MDYTLKVRAFIDIKRKDKAIAYAERVFRDLPVRLVGRYYKDDSLWECRVDHQCEYPDDKTALWETLVYFSAVESNWQLLVCPNSEYETVVSATSNTNYDNTGTTWCHFELIRHDIPS